MKLEINKIVTLGNNEDYLIVDKIEKDDVKEEILRVIKECLDNE